MKKILVYGLSNYWGGIENIVLSIIKRMPSDYFFSILLPRGVCLYKEKLEFPNIDVLEITTWGSNPVAFRKELKRIYQQSVYHYLWANVCNLANWELFRVTRKYSHAHIVLHAHGSSFEKKNVIKSLLIRILHHVGQMLYLNQAYRLLACSMKAAEWLYAKRALDAHIVKNGIDSFRFAYDEEVRNNYRKLLRVENKLVLVSVGRLCEVKNLEFLIDVFEIVHINYPNSCLLIVGEGELRGELEQQTHSLLLDDVVHFLGYRDDISSILQASDVLLMPSLHEGLGISLVEAQCCGLLPIASDAVPREAHLTAISYFISLKEEKECWADRLLHLFPYKRKDYHSEVVKAGYDINAVVDDIVNIFK